MLSSLPKVGDNKRVERNVSEVPESLPSLPLWPSKGEGKHKGDERNLRKTPGSSLSALPGAGKPGGERYPEELQPRGTESKENPQTCEKLVANYKL